MASRLYPPHAPTADTMQLLTYAVSAVSLSSGTAPVQINEPASITVTVDNPGGYSDLPETDYVQVSSIVFDFGPAGNDGDDLTAQSGWTSGITAPTSDWSIDVTGLLITFTPPEGGSQIFPDSGLAFGFPAIPINGALGTFVLRFTETASSPGDPASPNLYPPRISRARTLPTYPVPKFPEGFSLTGPNANPSFVEPNVATGLTLSWQGSDAYYTLSFPDNLIEQHADGTLLGAVDSFPNPAYQDPPIILTEPTLFVLTATYTPPGGGPSIRVNPFVEVGINYPAPIIDQFGVTPPVIVFQPGTPVAVTLTWTTSNGQGDDPVVLTFDPPFTNAELLIPGNDTFEHAFLSSGTILCSFLEGHTITLTVNGALDNSASQSVRILGFQSLGMINLLDSSVSSCGAFSPDGAYAFVLSPGGYPSAPSSLTALQASSNEPLTWVNTPLGIGQVTGFGGVGFTADGAYVMTPVQPTGTGFFQISESSNPTGWYATTNAALLGFNPIATQDGEYIFTNQAAGICVAEVNPSTDPSTWPVSTISYPFGSAGFMYGCSFALSPDDTTLVIPGLDYLFALTIDPQVPPSAWTPVQLLPGPTSAIFTLDGKYLVVCTYAGVVALTVDAGKSPAYWESTPVSGPTAGTTALSPDGRYLFIATDFRSSGYTYTLWFIAIDPGQPPSQWVATEIPGVFSGTQGMGFAFISADGQFLFVNGDTGGNAGPVQVIGLT